MAPSSTLGFSRTTLTTSVGRISYTWGGNGEPLVFLHGFGGGSSAFEWSLVYPQFMDRYQVFAPDLPGWGASEHQRRDYLPQDYLIGVREFLAQTCSQPVTIVASSVMAAWVVRLACETPALFRHLLLMCPTGLSDFGHPYNNTFFQVAANIPILNTLFYRQGIATRANIRSFLQYRLFAHGERVTEAMVEAYYQSATQPNAEYSAFSFLKGNLCFDLALWLPKLQTPTAIFWGETAQFAPPSQGLRLAHLSSLVKVFEVIPDTATTPQLELPHIVARDLRQAISALG